MKRRYGDLRRRAVVEDGTATYYIWDGLRLLETRNADHTLKAGFTHGPARIEGIGSCVEIHRASDSKRYYLLMDHRGSAYVLLDENKTEVATRLYNAFGETVRETGAWPDEVPFRYQSNWLYLCDLPDGSPLYLSPTRVYHAGVGRFLQRDPMREMERLQESLRARTDRDAADSPERPTPPDPAARRAWDRPELLLVDELPPQYVDWVLFTTFSGMEGSIEAPESALAEVSANAPAVYVGFANSPVTWVDPVGLAECPRPLRCYWEGRTNAECMMMLERATSSGWRETIVGAVSGVLGTLAGMGLVLGGMFATAPIITAPVGFTLIVAGGGTIGTSIAYARSMAARGRQLAKQQEEMAACCNLTRV